jgi:hypothetical protein
LQLSLSYITNYRYIAATAAVSATRLTGVFANVRAARGEIVGLRMDPAGCHLFPAEP